MQQTDVPQDAALFGRWHEICYALNAEGEYVLAPSAGWAPANLANIQAWEEIASSVNEAVVRVRSGAASPLLVYMHLNQMDLALLSRYVRLARWRVRRHLKPAPFARLTEPLRQRYADLFRIRPEDLQRLPERLSFPVPFEMER